MLRKYLWVCVVLLNFCALRVSAAEGPALSEHFVGAVGFKAPAAWKRQSPASTMRRIQYEIPAVPGDREPATFAVFYFGEGEGGRPAANVARWRSQFSEPPLDFTPEIAGMEVDHLKVTTVHFQGTYREQMAAEAAEAKKNYAMLGAIIEGPEGPVFFKLTGPRATVLSARPAFDAIVHSLRQAELKKGKAEKKVL